MNDVRVLLLPGLYDSGPEHWQSLWEREYPSFERIVQRDWETPDRDEWVATLQESSRTEQAGAVIGPAIFASGMKIISMKRSCLEFRVKADLGDLRGRIAGTVTPSSD